MEQVPTDCDAAAARRTRATRRWNWRRSSTRTTTWRGGGGSKWRTPSVWRNARSRSGSRTGAWNSKRRSRPSKSSMNRRSSNRAAQRAPVPIHPPHRPIKNSWTPAVIKDPKTLWNIFFFKKKLSKWRNFSSQCNNQSWRRNTFFIHFFFWKFCPAPNLCSSFAHF